MWPMLGVVGVMSAFLLFFELEKIEVITAIRRLLGAGEGFFGDAEERETGRQASAFCEPVRRTSIW